MTAGIELIQKYFPEFSSQQTQLFVRFAALYEEWNTKINLVSRKDLDNLYERHILHSLGIAKVISFRPGTEIMDLGTGGGFPGLPLAIFFPEVKFYLVDSIGKKIRALMEMIQSLGLTNAVAEQLRAEESAQKFDFVVNRAVAPLETLYYWTKNKFKQEDRNSLGNGLLCLKGGDLTEEIQALSRKCEIFELETFFKEEFFLTKKLVYVPVKD